MSYCGSANMYFFIDHTVKCCAVPSNDLTVLVQSEGGTARHLTVSSIKANTKRL